MTNGRRATLTVSGLGKTPDASGWTTTSPLPVDTGVEDKDGTNYQRMKVLVNVPANRTSATLTLAAGRGAGEVDWDDVRLVLDAGADLHANGHYYTEDFEHVDQGWGPFVYTVQNGSVRTHLSELHKNYTRDTISGRFSLKTWDDGQGLVYRTIPQTLRFQPEHAYRVRFDYQDDTAGAYNSVVGTDKGTIVDQPLAQTTDRRLDSPPPATDPKPAGWTDALPPQGSAPHQAFDQTFTTGAASCGDPYLGVVHHSDSGAMTMDNLVVDDLGPVSAAADCPNKAVASLSLSPVDVQAGQTSPVDATLTNNSDQTLRHGHLALTAPAGWTVTVTLPQTFAALAPGATAKVHYTVTPPADLANGAYPISAKAAFEYNGKPAGVTASTTALVAYASLAAAFNNVGTVDETAPRNGNFDGGGNAFSRQALAAAGAIPGAKISYAGVQLSWPSAAAGQPDNVTAQGQTIKLAATGSLAVLGSGSGTAANGTVTVRYSDGSTSQSELGMPNWCCVDTRAYGAKPVLDTDHNVDGTGPVHQGTHYYVYGNTLPLDPGKQAVAITLPTVPTLHLFGLAPRPLVAAPPTADVYASDLQWLDASNGWGPVERDHSLGEDASNDGSTISLGGTKYDKGLGTAPTDDADPSVVSYHLAGNCSTFTATVGLDDEETSRGSVTFAVVVDGKTVYSSPTLTPAARTAPVSVSIAGGQRVQLVTGTGGDGPGNDHGDWANALFHCG